MEFRTGHHALFLFLEVALATLVERLTEMLEPAVEATGFELIGLEYIRGGKHPVLRLYIDGEQGVLVDDCALVSHQVSAVLDVEDPIQAEYHLEISSPGADRPFFKFSQYEAYIGEQIAVLLQAPVENRRKFTAALVAVQDNTLIFELDGKRFEVAFQQIKKANLVPNFEK